jgi:hypothetical protein
VVAAFGRRCLLVRLIGTSAGIMGLVVGALTAVDAVGALWVGTWVTDRDIT